MLLTEKEYTDWYQKALKIFASGQTTAWKEHTYKVRLEHSPLKAKIQFLICYALNTWEHSDTAVNYLDEEQVISLIAKINQ